MENNTENHTEVTQTTNETTEVQSTFEQPDLLTSLLENNQLNVERLISTTFKACTTSYNNFNEICSSPEQYDAMYNKGLFYIPVSREANVSLSAKTLQEEFITTLAQTRHAFFCLLANAMNVDEENQTEVLALTLAMDAKDFIDSVVKEKFPNAFVAFEPSEDCAFYAISLLDLFREYISLHHPMYWEKLDETNLYERSFNY